MKIENQQTKSESGNENEEDGEGGEEDTGGLNDSGQLAKDFLKVKIEN